MSDKLYDEAAVRAVAEALKRLEHVSFGADPDGPQRYAYYFYDGPERENVIAKASAASALGRDMIVEFVRARAAIDAYTSAAHVDELVEALQVLLAAKHIREDNPHIPAADLADLDATAETTAKKALARWLPTNPEPTGNCQRCGGKGIVGLERDSPLDMTCPRCGGSGNPESEEE